MSYYHVWSLGRLTIINIDVTYDILGVAVDGISGGGRFFSINEESKRYNVTVVEVLKLLEIVDVLIAVSTPKSSRHPVGCLNSLAKEEFNLRFG